MTSPPFDPRPPRLTPILDGWRRRIRLHLALHGAGWFLGGATSILLLHFLLDRTLDLPSAFRILLLTGILLLFALLALRGLVHPLRRPFAPRDLALLIEKRYPELKQVLVTAVEGEGTHRPPGSALLWNRVLEEGAERLAHIDLGNLISRRPLLQAWGVALLTILSFSAVMYGNPPVSRVWLHRLFGGADSYPRRTFLKIAVPPGAGNYKVFSVPGGGGRILLAKGTDLPVQVEVEGEVPDRVHLEILTASSTESVEMPRRGMRRFRTLFPHVLHGFEFRALGGDDPGTPRFRVEVLEAPAALGLRTRTLPPAYAELPPKDQEGGLVEALPGSRVRVLFRVSEPVSEAVLHFEESGKEIVATLLGPGKHGDYPFPPGDRAPDGLYYGAEFAMPAKPDRYRIRLVSRSGLRERFPENHALIPLRDRPPRIRLFSPGAGMDAFLPGIRLPLRFSVTDDYGVRTVSWAAGLGGKVEGNERRFDLPGTRPSARKRFGLLVFLRMGRFLPEGTRKPREGDRITIRLSARDSKGKEGQASPPVEFRLDLVNREELLRRLQDRMRSIRNLVERSLEITKEQHGKTSLLQGELAEGGAGLHSRSALASLEAGIERTATNLIRMRDALALVTESHLVNGLDRSPGMKDLLERFEDWYRNHPTSPPADPSLYARIQEDRREGKIGNLDLLGRLGDMFEIAHTLATTELAVQRRAWNAARSSDSPKERLPPLEVLLESQVRTEEGLSHLLVMLEDWNDYQDLVRMTRRLRDAQRALTERIKSSKRGPEKNGK